MAVGDDTKYYYFVTTVTYFDGHQVDVSSVMPAQAGIQSRRCHCGDPNNLDSRFRGNDDKPGAAPFGSSFGEALFQPFSIAFNSGFAVHIR